MFYIIRGGGSLAMNAATVPSDFGGERPSRNSAPFMDTTP